MHYPKHVSVCAGILEHILNQAQHAQHMQQAQHAQQALKILRLLFQSPALCQVLAASLEEEDFQLQSGTATANAQSQKSEHLAPGHSSSSPVDLDADLANPDNAPKR